MSVSQNPEDSGKAVSPIVQPAVTSTVGNTAESQFHPVKNPPKNCVEQNSAVIEMRPFQLYSTAHVEALKDPEYILEDFIEEQSLTMVFGPPSAGKTFFVFDMMLSVAAGRPWMGKEVKQLPIVYVVAEGAVNIKKRWLAWKVTHRLDVSERMFFVNTPVQLTKQSDVDTLLSEIDIAKVRPGVIVFDTLAACFVGGEENAAKDVGVLMDTARGIQRRTGAAVVLVHHTGKAKENGATSERGSSAFRGAVDTMIRIAPDGPGRLKIITEKRKDDAPVDPMFAVLESVVVGVGRNKKPRTSCVLKSADTASGKGAPINGLTADLQTALDAFAKCNTTIVRTGDWQKMFSKSAETLNRRRANLQELGYIRCEEKGAYSLTPLGQASVTKQSGPSTDVGHHQSLSPPLGVTLTADTTDAPNIKTDVKAA